MNSNEGTGSGRVYERGAFNNRIENLWQAQKIVLNPKVPFVSCQIDPKACELILNEPILGKIECQSLVFRIDVKSKLCKIIVLSVWSVGFI